MSRDGSLGRPSTKSFGHDRGTRHTYVVGMERDLVLDGKRSSKALANKSLIDLLSHNHCRKRCTPRIVFVEADQQRPQTKERLDRRYCNPGRAPLFVDAADIELVDILNLLQVDKELDEVVRPLTDVEVAREATEIETGARIMLEIVAAFESPTGNRTCGICCETIKLVLELAHYRRGL